MTRTSDLIDVLVADATPVRRLRPPAARAACWLLFATAVMLFVGIAHGVRADLAVKLFGDDIPSLQSKAQEIKKVLDEIPGSEDVNVEPLTAYPAQFALEAES